MGIRHQTSDTAATRESGLRPNFSSENDAHVIRAGSLARPLDSGDIPLVDLDRGRRYVAKQWTIKTWTTLKSMELKFKLDVEFDEKTPDGRDVKAIVKMEDNKLVSIQTAKKDGEASTKAVREFNGDEVIQTMEIIGKDVTCVQKFKRV